MLGAGRRGLEFSGSRTFSDFDSFRIVLVFPLFASPFRHDSDSHSYLCIRNHAQLLRVLTQRSLSKMEK